MSTEPRKYKETLKEELFSKTYTKLSSDWEREYPVNKVKANLYDYDWEYKNNQTWENVEYSGEKVKIINTKLTIEDWNYVNAKKVINWRAFNDETQVVMSKENFTDLIESFK